MTEKDNEQSAIVCEREKREAVADCLRNLSQKRGQKIKAPLNGVGFFEGWTQSADRVYVDLGCQLISECSVEHALGILERKSAAEQKEAECSETRPFVSVTGSTACTTAAQDSNQRSSVICQERRDSSDERAEKMNVERDGPAESLQKNDRHAEIMQMIERMESLEKEAEAETQTGHRKGLARGFLLPKKPTEHKVTQENPSSTKTKEVSVMGVVKERQSTANSTQSDTSSAQAPNKKPSLFKQRLLEKRQHER